MTKEVAKKEQYEVADPSIFEGQSTGFEGTDAQTFKTPFLKIIQGLSPELSKSNSKYIPGAQLGQFCNSATQEIYDEISIIVLKVEHSLIIWKPDRGGFVGRHSKSEEKEIVKEKEGLKKWDATGNIINDTIEFFCVNAKDPSDLFILSLSVAHLKHAKSFATRLRMLKANGKPVNVSWAGIWKLSTVEDSNDQGTWYTIGNTPDFTRFITAEEKEGIVVPSLEMLKTAETDYSIIEGEEDTSNNNEDVTY